MWSNLRSVKFLLALSIDRCDGRCDSDAGRRHRQLGLSCIFRASCYSTRLSWANTPVINWVVCLGQKISEKEEGVVVLYLPIVPLQTRSGWSRYQDANPVPTSPLADDIGTTPSGPLDAGQYA